jgi:DNA-binding IclR family transcriptional regulator
VKYRLSKKAQQILDHLKKVKRPLSVSSIAKSLGLNGETVRSLLGSLRQRKLIEDKETTLVEFYQLTSEGQHFAAKGLPEIRLVKLLAKQGGEGSVESR